MTTKRYPKGPQNPEFSAIEEEQLIARWQELNRQESRGHAIDAQIVAHYDRLIRSRLFRFRRRIHINDLEDIRLEAWIGLFTALQKFDQSRGNRFSTVAVLWIDQKIRRGLGHSGQLISIPSERQRAAAKAKRMEEVLSIQLGRRPTDEEVANLLGLSDEEYRDQTSLPLQPISIDNQINSDDHATTRLAELVPDDQPSPEHVLLRREQARYIRMILAALDPRDLAIISYLYGLHGNTRHTLVETANQFKLSREGVRSIVNRAITRLRKIYYDPQTESEHSTV